MAREKGEVELDYFYGLFQLIESYFMMNFTNPYILVLKASSMG